jgi:cobalt/nickel transport system ATP-binding protein
MIRIDNLSFTYAGGITALSDVSLSIAAGEAVGVVGPNGAGKSTLANHLNGVLLPTRGSVSINGTVVSKATLEAVRKAVGVVFQDPDDMLFMPRVIDDVLFGPHNLGKENGEALAHAERVLKALGLWELRDRPPYSLSQGQKRFSAMAAVLVMSPQVIVLDEPTSDLDPRNRRRLIGLLNEMTQTRVVVSHDLDFVWDTCPRTVLLDSGRVVADGKTREILKDRTLLEAHGLELPLRLQD